MALQFGTVLGIVLLMTCGRRALTFAKRFFADRPYESTGAWMADGAALLGSGGGLAILLTIATASLGLLPGLPITPRLDGMAAFGIAGVVVFAWGAARRRVKPPERGRLAWRGLALDGTTIGWTVATVAWVAGTSPWAA